MQPKRGYKNILYTLKLIIRTYRLKEVTRTCRLKEGHRNIKTEQKSQWQTT